MENNNDNNRVELDKDSVVPIYYQLAKIFEKKIIEGEFEPGERLPPENRIADKYDISRMTVRKALSQLVKANMVYTEKGKGTFVAQPRLDDTAFELKSFYDEIKKMGLEPRSKLIGVEIVRARDKLREKLQVSEGTRILHFRLLISAEDEPLIYENKYVIYRKQKPILESELKDPTLSNLVTRHGDYFPTMSKKVLHASTATGEEAEVLEIDKNDPVFLVEQLLYDEDRNPIGWGKSICRGDRFKFTGLRGWALDSGI